MTRRNGDLWIGSYGGVQILSREYANFITSNKVPRELGPSVLQLVGLADQRVYHLNKDPYGTTWIGMRDAGYVKNNKVETIAESYFPYRKIRHIRWSNVYYVGSTYDHGLIKVDYTDLYIPETWIITQYSTQIPSWPSNTVLKA